jgi:hypothetical protein
MSMRDRLSCPYFGFPESAFWSKAVSSVPTPDLDLMVEVPFTLTRTDRIATAGSCFAQHIARYLAQSGYQYLITEPGPRFLDHWSPELRRKHNYGVFSARYGNIYTARQLLQLFKRAFGQFHPCDRVWRQREQFIDPYRPQIQPRGFSSLAEFDADQHYHLASVKRLFQELTVFVFTLGLTEAWLNADDGAVYPVCPGCGAGQFDPNKHVFRNFDYDDVITDLHEFVGALKQVNPGARVILTVSPVPLAATASGGHVAVSTAYSKSILRAAAGKISSVYDHIAYFPSYDVISGHMTRGTYFDSNLRDVTERGVAHVMRMFFKSFCEGPATSATQAAGSLPENTRSGTTDSVAEDIDKAIVVVCEEAGLDMADKVALPNAGLVR